MAEECPLSDGAALSVLRKLCHLLFTNLHQIRTLICHKFTDEEAEPDRGDVVPRLKP